ncbi:MAG TPA: hypothetical protein VLA19_25265, partial [Herpetosiphonaceae bacterium]|nr:hypothetical protein [Herpetosiphonaceae bacterium]
MASASVSTSSATRKRKPDPARVVQSYYHEVAQRGRRGAYRRTGDLYNISDETVRRFVHAAEERANTLPLPDELAYVPPPFADELTAIQAKSATERATEVHQRDISRSPAPQIEPRFGPGDRGIVTSSSRSNVAFAPQLDDATRHRVELGKRPTDGPEMPQAPAEPGHARPDIDVPGAEAPELPPEAFPNPEPNQPPHPSPEHDQAVPDWPSTGDESPTPKPKAEHPRPVPVPPGPPEPEPVPTPDPSPVPTPPLVQRVVVRV